MLANKRRFPFNVLVIESRTQIQEARVRAEAVSNVVFYSEQRMGANVRVALHPAYTGRFYLGLYAVRRYLLAVCDFRIHSCPRWVRFL